MRKTHWDRSLGSLSALTYCDLHQEYLASAWSTLLPFLSSSLNLVRHLNDTLVNENLLYVVHFTAVKVSIFKDSENNILQTLSYEIGHLQLLSS